MCEWHSGYFNSQIYIILIQHLDVKMGKQYRFFENDYFCGEFLLCFQRNSTL